MRGSAALTFGCPGPGMILQSERRHTMGVRLAFESVHQGEPVVVLHGLFDSSMNWRSIARARRGATGCSAWT